MLTDFFLFLLGLALLAYGAKRSIHYAVELSRILNLDKYGVGAGIIATITSLPELAVAVFAVLEGVPSVAVGTAFGSVVGLFLLSLGFLSLIAPLSFPKERKKELIRALTIVVYVVIVITLMKTIPPVLGVLLIILYFLYVKGLHEGTLATLNTRRKRQSAISSTAKLTLSIIVLLIGAEIVTKTITAIADALGISPFVIAFVAIALGTNLPEISVEAAAALSGNVSIAVGDILGSAVADLTLVLGAAAIVGALTGNPVVFSGRIHLVAGILLGVAVVLLKAVKDEKITIWEGVGLILAYVLVVSTEILSA